nr:MFS transporter [Armatimonadota bacterium]
FAGLLQLVSSYFAQRYGQRKLLVSWFSLTSRLLWVPILLIPFVLPPTLWVGAFLILSLLSSALLNVSNPLWMAWITDLVPADNRGRYFGQRNMYAGLVGMVTSIVGGAFLDTATKQHTFSEPLAFAVLFGIATVFAFPSFGIALNSPDPGAETGKTAARGESGQGIWKYYAAPFSDGRFRQIMLFFAGLVLAQTISAQFFTVYQLKVLQLNYTAMQMLGAVASLSSLAAMPLWGYLADKYGNKPILMICIGLVVLPPFLWLPTRPDPFPGLWGLEAGHWHVSLSKTLIIVLNLISGLGWAGVGLTQFNLMIGAAPSDRRTVYVSAVAAVSGLVGGVGPLLGGALIEALAHLAFPAHGLIRNSYHVVFIVSGLLRLGSLWLLRPVPEHGSQGARYVLDQLRAAKPLGSIAGIQKLSRAGSAQARQEAVQELGRLKTPVAVEELVKALDDVALPVREQAAHALGEIGDKRALPPLMRKLSDPASGIENAAATALGKIGDRAALPSLAAAAQLGPLPRQLAAIEALGRLPDSRATEAVQSFLPDPPLRLAALRALAEREDPQSAPSLRAELEGERDPAALAVLADALGRVGDATAVGPLLAALERTLSPTVRREILNAVGSLLGGRDSFYPFLALDVYARDETVGKILMNIQRRCRTRAVRERLPGAARLSVRVKQALEAYVSGDMGECLRRLAQAGALTSASESEGALLPAARESLATLAGRGRDTSAEEVLLGVFLVRLVTE